MTIEISGYKLGAAGCLLLSFLPARLCLAADGVPEAAIPSVVVGRGADEERRDDNGTKLVVGRAELARFGDQSAADVLRRVPGVTVVDRGDKGPEVRMRGLGSGYTQVLLNGQQTPPDFSIASVSPALIERIEVMRTTSAEFGAQAVAGTVNIVLRKALLSRQIEAKAGMGQGGGSWAPQATLTWSDKNQALSYVIAAALTRTYSSADGVFDNASYDAAGSARYVRRTDEHVRRRTDTASVTPRVEFALDGGGKLTWQSFLAEELIDWHASSAEQALEGTSTTYPLSRSNRDTTNTTLRSEFGWQQPMQGGAKMDLKAVVHRVRRATDFTFNGFAPDGVFAGRNHVDRGYTQHSNELHGKYSARPYGAHLLVLGGSLSDGTHDEHRNETMTDADAIARPGTHASYASSIRKLALFVQDDWSIAPAWSASLGVRGEALHTRGGDAQGMLRQRVHVVAPVLQGVWRGADKRQWRMAVSRTYRAPSVMDLVPRLFRVDNFNNPFNPDTQGNPALRPELATGLDTAYEHYFAGNGMISASLFVRTIDDVIRTRLQLVDGSWLATPFNDGRAHVRGMELEAKLPLRMLMAAAPAIDLRANLVRAWSRVDSVPGPHNRLDKQIPFSANLGADYRGVGGCSAGVAYHYQQGNTTRESAALVSYANVRRTQDLYGTCPLAAGTQVRLTFSNLLHDPLIATRTYTDADGTQRESSRRTSDRSAKIILEHKF